MSTEEEQAQDETAEGRRQAGPAQGGRPVRARGRRGVPPGREREAEDEPDAAPAPRREAPEPPPACSRRARAAPLVGERPRRIDATDPRTHGAPDTAGPAAQGRARPAADVAMPARVEQLSLGGDITYRLPDHAMLTPGPRTRPAAQTNDRVVESLTQRLRPVRHRRRRHRLHPRPDGHALRGRARLRHEGRARHRPVQEHRLRGRLGRRAHPQPDPGQVRDRHRDPQPRPRERRPRRRAAQPDAPGPTSTRW